jgi:hypothetical protein
MVVHPRYGYFGVTVNVALNVTIAVLVYSPLFATRRQFTNLAERSLLGVERFR